MSVGLIILIIVGLLILFGAGQRVLDRLRLNDKLALLFIALMIGLGFVPDIPIGNMLSINLGGALIPFGLCVYLLIRAGTATEVLRALLSSVVTGVIIFAIGKYAPNEPESMTFDPNYIYGLAAGVVAYIFGRSRRGAFVAGVLGMMFAQTLTAYGVWSLGIDQRLVLGGAGAYDVIVISGITAVLLAELIGEFIERIVRGKREPDTEFINGDFVRKEPEK